ncbi:MAG: type II secretion system F family protein, partial [Gammaproteobacteria bacterium]|nr:type II secretion system F family protein [Gammaproteobacteria bacterium]
MLNSLVPILGGISIAILSYVLFSLFYRYAIDVEVDEINKNIASGTFIEPIIARLCKLNKYLQFETLASSIDRKLVLAGNPGKGLNGYEYISITELIAFLVFTIFLVALILIGQLSSFTILLVIIITAIVTWVSFEWLNNQVSFRRKDISRLFPYFLDLSVMTMEAGTSFLETVDIYIRDNPDNALTEELTMFASEVNMGTTFEEALINFEHRISAEEVQNTLRAIRQGQKMGTPMASVLRDQAETVRFKRTQNAERAAEEMKVKLQGPAMLLMVSVLLLILGPALVEVLN